MARLCIPGVPYQKSSLLDAVRVKTQPALRPLPRPCRSLLPASIPGASVRSFAESKQGSCLPVRSPPPASARPTPRPSLRFTSLLEKRRAARQARPRPWVSKPKSPVTNRSNLSSASLVKPSKPKIHAPHTKETARVDNIRAKPEAPAKGPSKDKLVKKCVRFGETTVVSNPR